jgi:hypothetical protein
MGLHGDLMGFDGDLMVISWDFMRVDGYLMVIQWDLMVI